LAVGVPGEISGLYLAHQKFGRVPWAEIVKTATDLAQNGFVVSQQLEKSLKSHEKKISSDPVLK
jgi:gamma-glutamyltranspeptidase/glutathione hydrolase